MSTSIALDKGLGVAVPEDTTARGRRRSRHPIVGLLQNAGLLLLVVLAFPLAILVVGTPVALFVRLLIEIAERM